MFRSQSFIEHLRARPLHQRYLFLWSASAAILLLIGWLWTFQLQSELALLSAPIGQRVALAPTPQEPGNGILEQLGLIGDAMGKGTASLFSFLGSQFQSNDTTTPTEPVLQGAQEGDELDQFLPYQPFPE